MLGYIICDKVIDKNTEHDWLISIEQAKTALKKVMAKHNIPEDTEIHRKEYIFAGRRKVELWVDEDLR